MALKSERVGSTKGASTANWTRIEGSLAVEVDPTAERKPDVMLQLATLAERLEELSDVLGSLESRLAPVMNDGNVVGGVAEPAPMIIVMCEVSGRVRTSAGSVSDATARIRRLCERLEV